MSEDKLKIFISHSSKDEELLKWAIDTIKIAGCEPIYFEHTTHDGNVAEKIENLIKKADHCIIIYTGNATKSQFVNQEIGYIYKEKGGMTIIKRKKTKLNGFIYGYDSMMINDTEKLIRKLKSLNKEFDEFDYLDALNKQ